MMVFNIKFKKPTLASLDSAKIESRSVCVINFNHASETCYLFLVPCILFLRRHRASILSNQR